MNKFRIETLAATPNPQQVIWWAMHQDYSEDFVWDNRGVIPGEERAGELVIKYLLAGDRGHYGPLEHPQITLNVGYFPHSTMQQLRTHRVGVSFDVQSFRYTGQRLLDVANHLRDIEDVFYLRPAGEYRDRNGKTYTYSERQRDEDKDRCYRAAELYHHRVSREGLSEEHARGLIPFDTIQHFVLSCNVRSLMHLLDLRWKKDAQLEAQKFCDLLYQRFEAWSPAIAYWYKENRGKKARLAP